MRLSMQCVKLLDRKHVKNELCRTYLLTPWSRALLEKLTGSQLVKKFPEFYGIRRFITAFTRARHNVFEHSVKLSRILGLR